MIIIPSVPGMTVDMAGAVWSAVVREFDTSEEFLLCIETEFSFVDDNKTFFAHLFLLPDSMSLDIIFKELKLSK